MSVKEMMDGPLPLAVAMAADDQDLGVVPINRSTASKITLLASPSIAS